MSVRRVAYVVNTFPKLSETFIIGELAELQRRGIEVRILSLTRPGDNLQHEIVRATGLLERTTYEMAAFGEVMDGFDAQLVHAHFATQPTEAARALASPRRLPFTFTAHGYDVYRRPPGDFAERAAAAASVITVSAANGRHIADTFGVPADRLQVIPCGIDTDWFTPGVPDTHPPLIVCVARLRAVKQLDLLIRACAILRDDGTAFRCVVVGEGPERQALERLCGQLRLDEHVEFAGAAEQSGVRGWWQRAAVAVLSSRSEGMPVSLMEAASCGVPAVAPAVGGIPELVAHGITGLVVPPADAFAMAAALRRLLSESSMRTAMGMAARERAERQFSRATQVDRLLAVWSSIVN